MSAWGRTHQFSQVPCLAGDSNRLLGLEEFPVFILSNLAKIMSVDLGHLN